MNSKRRKGSHQVAHPVSAVWRPSMNTLSKRDAEALGVADMAGPQLRMRVLQVEGLMAELALVVEELLSVTDAGKSERVMMIAHRAQEALETVEARYVDLPRNEILERCVDVLDSGWAWFGDLTEQAADDRTGRCNRFMSSMERLSGLVQRIQRGPAEIKRPLTSPNRSREKTNEQCD